MSETLTLVTPGPLARTAQAITARLQLAFPPGKFQHALVPAKLNEKTLMQMSVKTPYVGLGWNVVEGDKDSSRLFRGETHWTVFLLTKNAAGVAHRYFGDKQGPGLFTMVEACTAVLHGWTEPGLGTAFVERAGNLYAEGWDADGLAMAGVDFTITYTLPAGEILAGAASDPLATLGIDWAFNGIDFTETITRTAA